MRIFVVVVVTNVVLPIQPARFKNSTFKLGGKKEPGGHRLRDKCLQNLFVRDAVRRLLPLLHLLYTQLFEARAWREVGVVQVRKS